MAPFSSILDSPVTWCLQASAAVTWGPLHLPPFCSLTWNTLAAETRQARAEERVAPKMPAVISGAKPDTMLMVCMDMGFRARTVRAWARTPHLGHCSPLCRQGAGPDATI